MAHKLFILFGATGSLSRLKIFPSLSNLYLNHELEEVKILAYGRKELDSQSFRKYLSDIPNLDQNFTNVVDYLAGDMLDSTNLKNYISTNKIKQVYCYHALPPNLYSQTIDFVRKFVGDLDYNIALEKPFGTSLSEAKKLAKKINKVGQEKFYLVDHYLAKKAVISLSPLDFNNVSTLEASIFEEMGIEGRENSYDQIGTIVDTVQNHILNILSKLAENFLDHLSYKRGSLVLGQYDGYTSLPGIKPFSRTETYVKAEFKYKDINIIVRSGKKMNETTTYILINYKDGKAKKILIKPNLKEKKFPHEYVIKDFLEDKGKFSVSLSDALLSWRVIEGVFKDGRGTKIRHYSKGSDFGKIEA